MNEPFADADGLMDATQVAKMLGVHPETVLRYVRAGTLECYRVGPRRIKFTTEQVVNFINEKQGK